MPRLKHFAILLIILLSHVPFSQCGSTTDSSTNYSVSKMYTRKLLVDMTLDYEFRGPNTRHDPRIGKSPSGRKNL